MRKPAWKRRGITREQAISKYRAVDNAYAQLSRRGAISRGEFEKLLNTPPKSFKK
jgi:hypothetical protein